MAQGYLQVDVVSDTNNFPITDASISISKTETPEEILEEVRTDSSGQTENVALEAPPAELSLAPSGERPYAEYTIRITAPGYEPQSDLRTDPGRRHSDPAGQDDPGGGSWKRRGYYDPRSHFIRKLSA